MSEIQIEDTDEKPERSRRHGRALDDTIIGAVFDSLAKLQKGVSEGLTPTDIRNTKKIENLDPSTVDKIMGQLKSLQDRQPPVGLPDGYVIVRSPRPMDDNPDLRKLVFRVEPADTTPSEAPEPPPQAPKRERRTKS